jgi:hypothetical protein
LEFDFKVNNIVEEMKLALRTLFVVVALFFVNSVFSQVYKMKEAVDAENFKRLEKVCLNAMEDKSLKKKPETYLYLSQAYIEQAKNEMYLEKNPDAIKLAVKYMFKGMKREGGIQLLAEDFDEVRAEVVKRQIEQAETQYKINKMANAVKLFTLAYQLDSTQRYPYYMAGRSAIAYQDTVTGEPIFKNLLLWYAADIDQHDEDAEQQVEPYVYFIDKFWKAKKYDSAKITILQAREHFGSDAKLNFFHKGVVLDQIKTMPPSSLMLNYVQEVLVHDPTDEELITKENSLYIYLIKNNFTNNRRVETDTLISTFIREKVAKAFTKKARSIKVTDVFVEKKAENVLWKLTEYFHTYSHTESAKYVLDKYISLTANSISPLDVADRWSLITNFAFETKEMPFASFVLQQAILKYPSNSDLRVIRTRVIAEKSVVRTSVAEQGALYRLMLDEYEVNQENDNLEKLIRINDKYIGLLISKNRFSTAKDVMADQKKFAPNVDHSERERLIAREDFSQNYYNTRTKGIDINGKAIQPYKWNGRISGCDAGTVEFDVQTKVADRINYFRRNAGVPEVLFDEATNEYCQKAALMMTTNRNLSHDPPRTWRCWSSEGAYAAKHSLLIKDANTSLAVTYIMDDRNPAAGNRRWLLYPNGRVYGHGSTDNIAVIWALDDSGSADTTLYMDNPIVWPPKGHVPQLMLFSSWTFAIYRDLTDAQVEVVQDGKGIPVTVEPFVRGYGAPTLVFKPTYNKAEMPAKSSFEVTVTLRDGSQFNYTVESFLYDPSK